MHFPFLDRQDRQLPKRKMSITKYPAGLHDLEKVRSSKVRVFDDYADMVLSVSILIRDLDSQMAWSSSRPRGCQMKICGNRNIAVATFVF